MTEDQKLEQYQEIIDRLQAGQSLSDEENSIVNSDASFKKYQSDHRQIEKAVSHNAMKNKLAQLNKLEEKYKDESPKKRGLSRRSYLLLAASCILLLLGYLMVNSGDDKYDGDLLAEDMLLAFTDPDATRGTDTTTSNDPYQLYSKSKYGLATTAFEELIESDDNPKHKFFYGVCLLQKRKWKDAEKVFENKQLQELRNYPLNYNLAVAKVGLEKTEEAIELLKSPSSGNELFNGQAEKYLNRITKIKNR